MSTTAIIRINVQDRDVDPAPDATVRLRQYADGFEDTVRPWLEQTLELARNMVNLDETSPQELAISLAATYESLAHENLPAHSRNLVQVSDLESNKRFGGDYKYVVDVHFNAFTDRLTWDIIGPSEYF